MPSYPENEVVDDSEPEREQLRRRERSTQRLTTSNLAKLRVKIEVIELTDNESDNGAPLPSNDNPQSDCEEDSKINFARFAYPGTIMSTKPLVKKSVSHFQASILNSTTETDHPPRRKPSHRFAAEFSDSQLDKLLKCVACQVNWTTRKSAPQKMIHVQACAKKHSLSDETVRILIQKEINCYDNTVSKSKGKGNLNVSTLPDPNTFFEEVVAQAAPRKRGRCAETNETVQTITRTRNLILDKARAVIGTSSTTISDGQEFLVHTQAIGLPNPEDGTLPPSTQPFGTSSLATKHCQATKNLFRPWEPSLHKEEIEHDSDILPATQALATSKLGKTHRALSVPDEDFQSSGNLAIPTYIDTTNIPSSMLNVRDLISIIDRGL
ncbi:hypothetical protein H0H81_011148 [Sphagnurus paluster]|uniref:Uncharacterized protein n=1 Tax=Sphagnurus paluster TaxID=117069 RepID=A0A9P7GPN9_9AGAR|nr:hypothetical protein H0H81_011148 [Sphagnurus paluster]